MNNNKTVSVPSFSEEQTFDNNYFYKYTFFTHGIDGLSALNYLKQI